MTDPDPPASVPAEIVTTLEKSSDNQLREIIHFAQQLLGERPQLTDAIEPRDGEELLRVEDHGAYTIAVVRRSDSGDDSGPFAYRVNWEPRIEDSEGKYRWHYLGQVTEGGDTGG